MLVLFSPSSERISAYPPDGTSVLACAYQLKVRSKNPKIFEYWFMGKISNILLNITSVDAGAILFYLYRSVAHAS